MIEARGLIKRFGRITAVDGVDLSVGPRGIVGFLGPNGAGKTTTMRMLTGFLPMTEGSAVVCGFDVFEEPLQVKARVGYLPETPPLYPELTVGEYLAFVAEIRGVESKRRLSRTGEVMEQVGLRGYERRLIATLSKGYRQRVGLAQAIVHDPKLLILDEPTSGLDPAQLVGIRALIASLAQDRAVVLSTHILQEVDALCERVVVIHRGRIVGDGTVDALAEAAGAGPWLELAVVGAAPGLEAELAALPAVASVERLGPDGVGRFRVRGAADLGPAISGLCARRGLPIERLHRHSASLEQTFLGLVGGDA
jgi:ABC-2 type transport system ATP-binding protein